MIIGRQHVTFPFSSLSPRYVQIVDSVSSSSSEDCEDSLMEIAREELAQFYDVANDREFDQIKQRYPNARMVLYKVADKIEEFDK